MRALSKPRKHPAVDRDLQPPEEESTLPWWMLGGGAALGGVGAALRYGISPEDAQKAQGFADLQNKAYGNSEAGLLQSVRDYAERGHVAATARPFGASAEETLRAIRGTPSAQVIGQGWDANSGEHYRAFADSPLSAYLQRTKEVAWPLYDPEQRPFPNSPLSASLGIKAPRSSYLEELAQEFGRTLQKGEGSQYWDIFGREADEHGPATPGRLRDALAAFHAKFPASKDEAPVGGAFDEWLKTSDPQLADVKRSLDLHSGIANRIEHPVEIYANDVIDPILGARKYLPWIGGGLALGGAGWLLYKYLAKKKREKEEAEAKAKMQGAAAPPEVDLRKAAQFFTGVLEGLGDPRARQPASHAEAFCAGFIGVLTNAQLP